MKEVENVTGRMGESEAVTPAEEVGNNVVVAGDTSPAEDAKVDADIGAEAAARSNGRVMPRSGDPGPDPWLALVQMGAQFVAALGAANDPKAAAHPWIERDPATGVRSLKMPLPPPETVQQLAETLSALAAGLRRGTE